MSMTFTEQQVNDIIKENLSLREAVISLEKNLKATEEELNRNKAVLEDMAIRCLKDFALNKNIDTKKISISVDIPVFMPDSSVELALTHYLLDLLMAEKNKSQL